MNLRTRFAAFLIRLASRWLPPAAPPPVALPAPYENKGQHWIQSYTGKAVDVFDLQANQVDVIDIAHALSQICRYTGHVREFYSVATHSLAVMKLTELMGHGPDMQLWALLHDAGEAYMADIAAPLKRHPIFEGYRKLEAENDRRIRQRFNIGLEDSQLTLIRTFDMALLTPERDALMGAPPQDWGKFPIIAEATEALHWARSRDPIWGGSTKDRFLAAFDRLNAERAKP